MKKSLIVLALAALAFASCKQYKKGEGDMEYILHEDKDGGNIQEGDFVALQAVQKTEEDSLISSSYEYDRPMFVVAQKSAFKGDIYAALRMLSEGDSATFKINMDSLQQKMGMPKPTNTKGKYMIFTFKIDKILPKGKATEAEMQTKIESFFKAEAEKAKNQEGAKINSYIVKKDLKPTVTASGLNYVIEKQGSGAKPAVGDTVQLNYTGSFLTGKVFDTSLPEVAKKANIFNQMRPYEPLKFAAGTGQTVPGFDEAVMLFQKGTKATVIIPSKLAYGEQGNPGIPPYMPLVFEMEVVNIIKPKPGTVAAPPVLQAPGQ
jgi:FKBP-type peptidyl-prolyl cis-trans isomerase FkpA